MSVATIATINNYLYSWFAIYIAGLCKRRTMAHMPVEIILKLKSVWISWFKEESLLLFSLSWPVVSYS